MTVPQPTRADESARPSRWVARPWLARLLRVAIWLVPVALSFAVIWGASKWWSPDELGVAVLVWWLIFGSAALVVLLAADRLTRQLLPLAALLRIALVFPDRAPSRFGAALRSGTPNKLLDRRPPRSHDLLALVRQISEHDRATRGHSERVRAYSQLIGQEMKLSQEDLDRLSWAALLHDVGKLQVPATTLNKQGMPDEQEWDQLRTHPAVAQSYLAPFGHWLGDWGRAASEHHERWDGQGYPSGLAAQDIHEAGRIVSVADAYDVMTSVRSYKKSMPTSVARQEIAAQRGSAVRSWRCSSLSQCRNREHGNDVGALSWLAHLPDMLSRAPAAVVATAVAVSVITGAISVAERVPLDVAETASSAADEADPGPGGGASEGAESSDPTGDEPSEGRGIRRRRPVRRG